MLLLGALLAADAHADVRRWAILVGNNEGAAGARPLYFAEHDARKVQGVLNGLGDVRPDDTQMLLGRTRVEVLSALAQVRAPIREARARGDQTVLYFYYSGHADGARLQIGRTWVTWDELAELLPKSGADVRVAFIDACQSGSLTKGGTRAPSFVFDVNEKLDSSGSVFITSSTGDEASQESNEIGGSYFTFFLASALSGVADEDGDGRVTLSETYRYVYHETVYRTAKTRSGTQHPTQALDVKGIGELTVTQLDRAGSTLVFPAANPGTFAVFDVERRMFVAEVEVAGGEAARGDRKLSLRPGRYLVQRRYPTHLSVAALTLAAGATTRVETDDFRALEYEDDVAKGSIDKVIRRSELPRLSMRATVGARRFTDDEVEEQYFPPTANLGVEARFAWRTGPWASLELVGGSGSGALRFEGLDYGIPVRVGSASFGAGVGIGTREAAFRTGIGAHLEGIALTRVFPGQDVERQQIFTIAPGAAGWAGWYPGRFELELGARIHYLPYIVDGRDGGMGYTDLLLGIGYRF